MHSTQYIPLVIAAGMLSCADMFTVEPEAKH
jgi:hypothetical protein